MPHRRGHRAGRPQRRRQAARRHEGVGIERVQALGRRFAPDALDVALRVHALEVGALGERGRDRLQAQRRIVQSVQHRLQFLFGVVRGHKPQVA